MMKNLLKRQIARTRLSCCRTLLSKKKEKDQTLETGGNNVRDVGPEDTSSNGSFVYLDGRSDSFGSSGDETVRVWLVSAPLTTTVVEVEGW